MEKDFRNSEEPQKIIFEISGKDLEKLKIFKKEHEPCFEKFHDLIGAQFVYTFIPTGLGMYITVKCSCGEKQILDAYFG